MDAIGFLAKLQQSRHYRGQMVAARVLPERAAEFASPQESLPPQLSGLLAGVGVERLYAHQAAALDAVRAGEDVVIATGTASGKSLCYQLPIFDALLADADARALYLAPAKALAYDQLGKLTELIRLGGLADVVRPACYDGDTPSHKRQTIRRSANVILSNPDMLHVSILPRFAKFAQFFADLRYVILDEIHSYRGIFGSHVAGVIWRLLRVCRHFGATPTFICASATLGNPQDLAERLTHRPMKLIDRDASPRGRKHVVLWNPPWLDEAKLARRSGNVEAMELMQQLLEADCGTITFAKARVVAELIYKFVREHLSRRRPELAKRVAPYRGGYLPNERREIEAGLFSGRLLGVCSTNALELGIDVGALDAAIVVGFPSTFCSLWQQIGRAGRRADESLAILVAYDDPIDQYLMRTPDFVFDQPLEHAVIDPQNPHILAAQLGCAAAELPLEEDELGMLGDIGPEVAQELVADERLRYAGEQYHWSRTEFAAAAVNLRQISDASYNIVDIGDGRSEVIGQVDAISAPELVYPEAIYLHQAVSYIVRELDQELRTAKVEPFDADYYTQPVLADDLKILTPRYEDDARGGGRHFGDVRVQWQTIAFRKFKYYTLELIGQTALHLEPLRIDTVACWLQPPKHALAAVTDAGLKVHEALAGVRNLLTVALPPLAMCDRFDIGGIVDSSQLGVATIFLYDRYEGGLGYARHAYEYYDELLRLAGEIVGGCDCECGCPGCVAPPNLRVPIQHDPDVYRGYEIPDKRATTLLLDAWLGSPGAGASEADAGSVRRGRVG